PGQVTHAEHAAVRFDAPLADGEPETQPGPIGASLREGAKELLELARRKAAAFVLDFHQDAIGGRVRPQRYVAVGAAELERVLQQVGARRREDLSIGLD